MKSKLNMKSKLLLIVVILAAGMYGYSNIILITHENPNARIMVKIENLADFPDIVIVGVNDCMARLSRPVANVVDSTFMEVHRACPLVFYAVRRDYFEERGINRINWRRSDRNSNVMRANITIDATRLEPTWHQSVEILKISYIIEGFNDESMVLTRKSNYYVFGDDRPNRFEYDNWLEMRRSFDVSTPNLRSSF